MAQGCQLQKTLIPCTGREYCSYFLSYGQRLLQVENVTFTPPVFNASHRTADIGRVDFNTAQLFRKHTNDMRIWKNVTKCEIKGLRNQFHNAILDVQPVFSTHNQYFFFDF